MFKYVRNKVMWIFSLSLIAFIILQIVISALLVSLGDHPNVPKAQQGVLDLTSWDNTRDGLIKLDGQWEFYWEQHLEYSNFQQGDALLPDLLVEVPNEWNGYEVSGDALSGSGYGTYRLKVNVSDQDLELAIKVLPLATAYRVFVNDQLVVFAGQAGKEQGTFEANGKPKTVLFTPPDRSFDLIVQVSNFDYAKGGMNDSLLLGSPKDMLLFNQNLLYKDFFLMGSLFIAAFYSITMYFMNRDEKVSLFFGLVCFVFFCRIPLTSGYYIYEIFPTVTIQVTEWINYMTFHLDILFYAFMIREFFPQLFSKRFSRLFNLITIMIVALLMVLPLSVYSRFYLISDAIGFLMLLYPFYVIVRAAINRLRYSWLVCFGNGLLLTFVIQDVVNTELNRYEMDYFSGYGMLVFTYIYSLILARRFSQTFLESKSLSHRLLEVDKLKDEFLANTSHELRTPLQGIISISESLIEGVEGPLTGRQAKNLGLVVSSGKRLTQLINDLLDVSKLKHRDLQLSKKYVNVQALSEFVLQMSKQMYPHKEIEWTYEIPASLPPVIADENRLIQILSNLVDNAAKFTEKGEIRITAEVKSETVEISVSDTGIGIHPEQLENIFEPFTQGDASMTRTFGGVGLGLSIAKHLTELHGGRIRVESTLGAGSNFTVALPIGNKVEENESISRSYIMPSHMQESATVEADAYKVVQSGEHILVVDDDPAAKQSVVNLLKLDGYTVTAVTNGKEALDAVHNNRDIRLVILDVMMPGLSGYDVCRVIRETKSGFELPVLMITAKHQPEDLVLGFQVGANDYLVKPFERTEFKARVNTLIELNKSIESAKKSEIAFLQAQIKPHFIYNALGAIMSLCYIDGRKAGNLIEVFSRYLRMVFELDQQDTTVKLSRELEFIEVYTKIEEKRFGKRLKVMVDVEPSLLHSRIAPLTVQPLVENAIGHGVTKKVEGGWVKLTIKKDREWMKVEVEDNGVGMSEQKLEQVMSGDATVKGIGLANINKRVISIAGIPLKIESQEGLGTKVTLYLPVLEQ